MEGVSVVHGIGAVVDGDAFVVDDLAIPQGSVLAAVESDGGLARLAVNRPHTVQQQIRAIVEPETALRRILLTLGAGEGEVFDPDSGGFLREQYISPGILLNEDAIAIQTGAVT